MDNVLQIELLKPAKVEHRLRKVHGIVKEVADAVVAWSAQDPTYPVAGVMLVVQMCLSAMWLKVALTDTTFATLLGKYSIELVHGDTVPTLIPGLANGSIVPLAVAGLVLAVFFGVIAFLDQPSASGLAACRATVLSNSPSGHERRPACGTVDGIESRNPDLSCFCSTRIRTIALTGAWVKLNAAAEAWNNNSITGFCSRVAIDPRAISHSASVRAEYCHSAIIVRLKRLFAFWADDVHYFGSGASSISLRTVADMVILHAAAMRSSLSFVAASILAITVRVFSSIVCFYRINSSTTLDCIQCYLKEQPVTLAFIG